VTMALDPKNMQLKEIVNELKNRGHKKLGGMRKSQLAELLQKSLDTESKGIKEPEPKEEEEVDIGIAEPPVTNDIKANTSNTTTTETTNSHTTSATIAILTPTTNHVPEIVTTTATATTTESSIAATTTTSDNSTTHVEVSSPSDPSKPDKLSRAKRFGITVSKDIVAREQRKERFGTEEDAAEEKSEIPTEPSGERKSTGGKLKRKQEEMSGDMESSAEKRAKRGERFGTGDSHGDKLSKRAERFHDDSLTVENPIKSQKSGEFKLYQPPRGKFSGSIKRTDGNGGGRRRRRKMSQRQ